MGMMYYKEKKPMWEAEQGYEAVRRRFLTSDDTEDNGLLKKAGGIDIPDAPDRGIMPDFDAMNQWNPDVTGWIYGPGTSINYPVVQGTDNVFYLNHTADKAPNSNGAVFMDWKNEKTWSDDLTVLYGHHIRGGKMFSSLSGYKKQEYFEEHPELFLYTPEGNYRVLIFAGVVTDGRDGSFPRIFETKEEREQWLDTVIQASAFQVEERPSADSRFLALCTCTYEYDDARYVVYGELKEIGEKGDKEEK